MYEIIDITIIGRLYITVNWKIDVLMKTGEHVNWRLVNSSLYLDKHVICLETCVFQSFKSIYRCYQKGVPRLCEDICLRFY